jgi:hypothetical protein
MSVRKCTVSLIGLGSAETAALKHSPIRVFQDLKNAQRKLMERDAEIKKWTEIVQYAHDELVLADSTIKYLVAQLAKAWEKK